MHNIIFKHTQIIQTLSPPSRSYTKKSKKSNNPNITTLLSDLEAVKKNHSILSKEIEKLKETNDLLLTENMKLKLENQSLKDAVYVYNKKRSQNCFQCFG